MIPLHDDNPTRITPVVTVGLIVACVLVFLWQITLAERDLALAVHRLGMIPAVLFGRRELPAEIVLVPPWATLITSMFLHGGWMHLIGNMLYLWIFGNNVEDSMGHVRFVFFYLACGIAAALTQATQDTQAVVPMIGASGAIAGVLGAYLLLYPRARVLVLIPLGLFMQLVRIPAVIVLGVWFLLQFLATAFADGAGGGVAYWAHVGGFVAGVILIIPLRDRRLPLLGGRRPPPGPPPEPPAGPWSPPRRRGPWG